MNQAKSAAARAEEPHFVGFSFRRKPEDGAIEVFLSTRSKERIDARIRELTPRADAASEGTVTAWLRHHA